MINLHMFQLILLNTGKCEGDQQCYMQVFVTQIGLCAAERSFHLQVINTKYMSTEHQLSASFLLLSNNVPENL